MSKSSNMLRTRRKDVNIKPNRRLDRKSSRGMIYENEELRLRTININAEIERGQSDIKKLRRENEQLRKEIWCLRDEYEKLDKLLKEKEENDQSCSSSTGSSETESCSSCSESEDNETTQNLENVQKTNLKNLHVEFDHLSVVPEENSTENSDRNSNRASLVNENGWNFDADIIKPDQSYPSYDTLQNGQKNLPAHFFSPTKISQSYQEYMENNQHKFQGCKVAPSPTGRVFNFEPAQNQGSPNLQPISKDSTDVLVKMDNQPLTPSIPRTSFSNGGNLEELLNDIETISNDILQMSSTQKPGPGSENGQDIMSRIQNSEQSYVPNSKIDNLEFEVPENFETIPGSPKNIECPSERPYKSELNVVLMPTPMPIIGFDKYRNLQNSLDSLTSRSLEKLSVSYENLRILPNNLGPDNIYASDKIVPPPGGFMFSEPPCQKVPNTSVAIKSDKQFPVQETSHQAQKQKAMELDKTNPFYFSNLSGGKDGVGTSETFLERYQCGKPFSNRETGIGFKKEILEHVQKLEQPTSNTDNNMYNSKSNLMEFAAPLAPPENLSSENEEILKFKTSKGESNTTQGQVDNKANELKRVSKKDEGTKEESGPSTKKENPKSPKLRKTRKVSIYFKGKKDKQRSLSLDTKLIPVTSDDGGSQRKNLITPPEKPATKKHSFLESFRLHGSSFESKSAKKKVVKTSSVESRLSNYDNNTSTSDSKTPASATSADSIKAPSFDVKSTQAQSTTQGAIQATTAASGAGDASANPTATPANSAGTPGSPATPAAEPKTPLADRKSRKSISTSPERKHVHHSTTEDVGDKKKVHKKHHKKDRSKTRRSTASTDRQHRERSFSVCTNRSNNLLEGRRFGYGGFYDDNSDRERSNSMSSCDTLKERKLSNLSQIPTGKIPWCGCWGNGCL